MWPSSLWQASLRGQVWVKRHHLTCDTWEENKMCVMNAAKQNWLWKRLYVELNLYSLMNGYLVKAICPFPANLCSILSTFFFLLKQVFIFSNCTLQSVAAPFSSKLPLGYSSPSSSFFLCWADSSTKCWVLVLHLFCAVNTAPVIVVFA